ncbi:MAG: methylated-DNA--[protein]-cysteine S-methyltransferase [Chloroflexota bacterium]|nr:methylated-DNA--[protein]-cysteine S-methyltransferase [Chloroflexota bacterium]
MTTTARFALFETAISTCAITWGGQGVVGVHLPEATDAALRARVWRRWPGASEGAPPPEIQSAIEAMVALLGGRSSDLSGIALDMTGIPEFHQRVYAVARTIPLGSTVSYGEVAARLGEPAWPAARYVGQALGHNPFPLIVPCHRVIAAGGKLGGFSARGGATTKRRLLARERAGMIQVPLFT